MKKEFLHALLTNGQAAVQSQTGILEGHLGYILMSRIIVHVKFMFSEKEIKFKKDLPYFFDHFFNFVALSKTSDLFEFLTQLECSAI